ncbi:TolC family protein [Chitinophaga deserti]|uniref:TolC family protein n=1 Tax=Chitinophaga deserti TaxID=2164099 RepID=UPI000D6CA561|nr:TolC family protein [Chitinophaga deserti]
MKKIFIILITGSTLATGTLRAQDSLRRVMTLQEVFHLTETANPSLKVAEAGVAVARQKTEVAKLQQLPGLNASLGAGYIGNPILIDRSFSNTTHLTMPHFANSFALQASQLIFKGNAVKNNIAAASLQEQLAELSLQKSTQDMKLLSAGNYFDLYKLYNQRQVYHDNIVLAGERLKNIRRMHAEGMVTRNDVIRNELLLSNLQLAENVIGNNINILNKQLTTALSLPDELLIHPDTTMLHKQPKIETLRYYQALALGHQPDIKMAAKSTEIAEAGVKITKADRLPSLSAYAGNNLTRPVTSVSPALDAYSNGWQAGLTLSFNIASIYTAPKHIKQAQLQVAQLREAETERIQQAGVSVNAAYVKHNEAITQWHTLEQNMRLADENYRIIEKKYLNQLALAVDLLDATNAKLDAELQYTNAEINILFTYYQLLKTTGQL